MDDVIRMKGRNFIDILDLHNQKLREAEKAAAAEKAAEWAKKKSADAIKYRRAKFKQAAVNKQKARRKARKLPSAYKVEGQGVRPRYFHDRKKAIAYYLKLKHVKEAAPKITNQEFKVFVRTSLQRLAIGQRPVAPNLPVVAAPRVNVYEPLWAAAHPNGQAAMLASVSILALGMAVVGLASEIGVIP